MRDIKEKNEKDYNNYIRDNSKKIIVLIIHTYFICHPKIIFKNNSSSINS